MSSFKATLGIALTLSVLSHCLAAPPKWVAVPPGNGTWADSASVRRVDGKLLVWFVQNTTKAEPYPYSLPGIVGPTYYKSTTTLQSIDCKAGKWAQLQAAYYTEERMSGEFLGSYTTPDNAISFAYPIPGTVGSSNVDFACSQLANKR